MKYTDKQIKNAKRNYNRFNRVESVTTEQVELLGSTEANNRVEFHNDIVSKIYAGDKDLEKEWKLFFLKEEVKSTQKADDSKDKKNANKVASADILEPVKNLRKIGDFGKWLNVNGNKFRKQHFNKKYTQEAVNAFLATL